jgi:hypothetical protein
MNSDERITGPVSGYWIATFAYPVGAGYVGGARIFRLRPRSYWDGAAVAEVLCTESAGSAEDAHAAAMELAVLELRRLR